MLIVKDPGVGKVFEGSRASTTPVLNYTDSLKVFVIMPKGFLPTILPTALPKILGSGLGKY